MSTGRLVTWKELKTMGWSFSPAQTHRMIAKGRFPKPVRFPVGTACPVSWRYEEVLPLTQKPFLASR